ncbi:zinc finger CCCH domain-containing protein 42-like [Raphanus sativus]|uniref:Zinc finger CCCH domain-containing protein 42-like n=1 Tax=Raphanus sativus TaxID=3726 RepID=A0A6J0NRN2_RAPSA|nr:zinc finger CCCH domain-containing protein 42-like [Raphanus sativus]
MEIEEEAKETDTRTEESTSIEETEEQDTDLRRRESYGRTDGRRERDPRSSGEKKENATQTSEYPARNGVADCYFYLKNGRCGYGLSCRFNHPPMRHEMVQPSPYPGARDCRQYLQTGQCSYGPKCRFNHSPAPVLPERVSLGAIDCKQYLQTGRCSYGPKCRFNHPPAPVLPQWVSRQNCKFFQKGSCTYGSGCKFTHSMSGDGAETMRQDTTWGKKRHGANSSARPWKRERQQAHYLEEQKQKKRKVDNLRIGPSVQSGEGGIQTEQRLEEIPENSNVNAQENLQEQADMERQNREAQEKAQEERRQQIDNARRESRLRLERMKPRALTSNVDQLREALPDIGIDRKEGDGF